MGATIQQPGRLLHDRRLAAAGQPV